MNKKIDPKEFGIKGKTIIEEMGENAYAIVINRKSRIIMSDGIKILEKAEKMRSVIAGAEVSLSTSAPICGKTSAFLKKHSIMVINKRD